MTEGLLKKDEGPEDISLNELSGTINRTVHVAFRRQVHHILRSMPLKESPQLWAVANIDICEDEARIPGCLRDGVEARGVSELVNTDNASLRIVQQMAN